MTLGPPPLGADLRSAPSISRETVADRNARRSLAASKICSASWARNISPLTPSGEDVPSFRCPRFPCRNRWPVDRHSEVGHGSVICGDIREHVNTDTTQPLCKERPGNRFLCLPRPRFSSRLSPRRVSRALDSGLKNTTITKSSKPTTDRHTHTKHNTPHTTQHVLTTL